MSVSLKTNVILTIAILAMIACAGAMFMSVGVTGDESLIKAYVFFNSGAPTVLRVIFVLALIIVLFTVKFRLSHTYRIICPSCHHSVRTENVTEQLTNCPSCQGSMQKAVIKRLGINMTLTLAILALIIFVLYLANLFLTRKAADINTRVTAAIFNIDPNDSIDYSVIKASVDEKSLGWIEILIPSGLTKEKLEMNIRHALEDFFLSEKVNKIVLTASRRSNISSGLTIAATAGFDFTGEFDSKKNIPLSGYYTRIEILPKYFIPDRIPLAVNQDIFLFTRDKKETDLYQRINEFRHTLEHVWYSVPNNSPAIITEFKKGEKPDGGVIFYYRVNIIQKKANAPATSGWVPETVVFPEKQ